MPNYDFEFASPSGRLRQTFTLDDHRPLGPQVDEIFAELNARGVMLEGAPDERPAILWQGSELDPSLTPMELEISNVRALEIVMVPPTENYSPDLEGPPTAYFPKGAYASALLGFAGGSCAWFSVAWATDLSAVVSSYALLDIVSMGFLGGCVGTFVLGGTALRSDGALFEGGLLGLLLGGIAGVLGGVMGVEAGTIVASLTSFTIGRIVLWAVSGLTIGLILGLRFWNADPHRALDGALWGTLFGAVGGAVLVLPGPFDFWQAVAYCLTGFGIGVGLVLPGQRRSWGLLELEIKDDRAVGLMWVREWLLRPGSRLTVAQSVELECDGRECTARSVGGREATVMGRPLPTILQDCDRLVLGDSRYVFRVLAGGE